MCMIEYADDRYDYHRAKMQLSRKVHKCNECRREIQTGEKYECVTAGYTGSAPDTWRTCEHCIAARQWLQWECDGWLYGGVYEDLSEHRHEEVVQSKWALLRLIVGMGKQWKYGNGHLMPIPTLIRKAGDHGSY